MNSYGNAQSLMVSFARKRESMGHINERTKSTSSEHRPEAAEDIHIEKCFVYMLLEFIFVTCTLQMLKQRKSYTGFVGYFLTVITEVTEGKRLFIVAPQRQAAGACGGGTDIPIE